MHEVHNEYEPAPSNLASLISEWIHERIGQTSGSAQSGGLQRSGTEAASAPAPSAGGVSKL